VNQSVRSDITIISKLLRFYFVTISPEFSPLFIPDLTFPTAYICTLNYTLPPRFPQFKPVRCTLSIIRVFLTPPEDLPSSLLLISTQLCLCRCTDLGPFVEISSIMVCAESLTVFARMSPTTTWYCHLFTCSAFTHSASS